MEGDFLHNNNLLIPRRRLLAAGLGGGAAALLVNSAQADTAFTSFGFPATGAPTNRTMPNRLAEVKNVLDWGADPTGNGGTATATTAAIQNAVDAAVAAGGGTVFFPGTFAINAPITFNHNGAMSIRFVGTAGSGFTGDFDGFHFDRVNVNSGSPLYTNGDWVFQSLSFSNPHSPAGFTAGGVRVGSSRSAAFYDCSFLGQCCLTAEDSCWKQFSKHSFRKLQIHRHTKFAIHSKRGYFWRRWFSFRR